MLRSLGRKLLAFATTSPPSPSPTHFRRPFANAVPDASLTLADPTRSFTFSYLTGTCGLSPASALSASKKIQIETTSNPDVIIQTFRERGFSQSQVASTIAKCPALLLANPLRTIKAKLDFLCGAGFSEAQIADIVSANPAILHTSLQKKITLSVSFLETVLPSRAQLVSVLKLTNALRLPNMAANISALRSLGMPEENIMKLLLVQPRALTRAPEEFGEAVTRVREMGLDLNSGQFARVLAITSYMSKETLKRKTSLYRSLGWSEDEISTMFRQQPYCLGIADEQIKRKLDFFKNKLGWDSVFLTSYPVLLLFNTEKRIIPRCRVLKLLMSRDLIKRNTKSARRFVIPSGKFFEKYVRNFEKEVPEVVEAYEGDMDFDGWGLDCREVGEVK